MEDDIDSGPWCSACANCSPQLLPPEEIGCFCEELGVEIGVHEVRNCCSYFLEKEDDDGND